jgi:hypothetical protein
MPAAAASAAKDPLADVESAACGSSIRGDGRLAFLPGNLESERQADTSVLAETGTHLVFLDDKLCRLVGLLQADGEPLPPASVGLNHADGIYYEGDFVTVDLQIPTELDHAYLYVAYVDPAGIVFHLFPNSQVSEPLVRGGEALHLGTSRTYRAVPPFGRGLLVTVLSPTLLPTLVVTEAQPLDRYLASIERLLSYARSRGVVHIRVQPLETRAR